MKFGLRGHLRNGHLRNDVSRPGDLYAMAGGLHAKDVAMDPMISSIAYQSQLYYIYLINIRDYAMRLAENYKFNKDLRNLDHLQASSTQRLISLAMNQRGRRGPHFEAILLEYASLLIKRSLG